MTKKIVEKYDGGTETLSIESVEDFAEMVLNNYDSDDEMYFTTDTSFDDGADGWFGIKVINIFDGEVLMIGYMGGGSVEAYEFEYGEFTQIKVQEYIEHYLSCVIGTEQDTLLVSVCRKDG